MRIRNVKGADEKVRNHSRVIQNPNEYKGKWGELFGNNHPIYIEIGMGKGQFVLTHAEANESINYIGIEYMTNVLFKALDKVDLKPELKNLHLIRMSAEDLLEVFDEGEIDRIYLNFSDPWPKERHAKKRLTNRRLLEKYNVILKKGSQIVFKTDNIGLFEYSVEQISEYNMKINKITRDLHDSEYVEGNVMTEYEEKYIAKEQCICMLEAQFK